MRWSYYFLKHLYGILRHFYRKVPKTPYKALVDLDRHFNSSQVAPNVLCLGDSVWERVADQDQDRRTLSELIQSALEGKYTTTTIWYSAYHMAVFHELLAGLRVTKKRPDLVVLPVNMRSFSPQWDMEPKWQYTKEINILRAYRWSVGRIIGKLNEGASQVPDYMKLLHYARQVHYPLSTLRSIEQFYNVIDSLPGSDEEKMYRKKQIFIFHYAYPLHRRHAKLTNLFKVLNLLLALKIKVFVYITPVNVMAAEKFIGSGFNRQFSENVRQVTYILEQFSIHNAFSFANWSSAFPSNLFFYDDIASEHLNERGRVLLSGNIADGVLKLLGSEPESSLPIFGQ